MGNCASANEVIAERHRKKLKHQAEVGDDDLKEIAVNSFQAQQTLLGQIITMSSLLLGFVVTGSLLTVTLTGQENFTEPELMWFLKYTGISAVCACLSLVLAFISSVRGASAMELSGPFVAEFVITSGSALYTILSELFIYISLLAFIISMMEFLLMEDTGPSICPFYRGESSACSRLGQDLYSAAKDKCEAKYGWNNGEDHPCTTAAPECLAETPAEDCLCLHYCWRPWEHQYNYSQVLKVNVRPGEGVISHNYDWFAYYIYEGISGANRQKFVVGAADHMCKTSVFEDAYANCFHLHEKNPAKCTAVYAAKQKANQCQDDTVAQSAVCAKVCHWNSGLPPKIEMRVIEKAAMYPLCVVIGLFILGRSCTLILRCSRAVRRVYDLQEQFLIGDVRRELAHDCYESDEEAGLQDKDSYQAMISLGREKKESQEIGLSKLA